MNTKTNKARLKHLSSIIKEKNEGRIEYLKNYGCYIVVVPQGYKCKETIYKNRVFYSITEMESEWNIDTTETE